jgi:hypothetical protein
MEVGQGQVQLHREGMWVQKAFDGVMIGSATELAVDNADHLAVMQRRITLAQGKEIGLDRDGPSLAGPARIVPALIPQAEHPLFHKAPGLRPHGGAFQSEFLGALGDPLGEQDNWPNDFILVLKRIREVDLEWVEILGCGHG